MNEEPKEPSAGADAANAALAKSMSENKWIAAARVLEPDSIHQHPTVQGLIAGARLHRWLIIALVVIAIVLGGLAVFDHLIKAASDFS